MTNAPEVFREERIELYDPDDHWTQVWHCTPPARDVQYFVVRDEWLHDYSERHIYEVRFGDTNAA